MTLNKLHKLLGELKKKGHGREKVTVSKDTFQDNRESDGCTILDVHGLGIRRIFIADDDGGVAINKDGTERTMRVLILAGSSGVNAKGELISNAGSG